MNNQDNEDKYSKKNAENEHIIGFLAKSQKFNHMLAIMVMLFTFIIVSAEYKEVNAYKEELVVTLVFTIPLTCLILCFIVYRNIQVASIILSQILLLYLGFIIGFGFSLQIKIFRQFLNKNE